MWSINTEPVITGLFEPRSIYCLNYTFLPIRKKKLRTVWGKLTLWQFLFNQRPDVYHSNRNWKESGFFVAFTLLILLALHRDTLCTCLQAASNSFACAFQLIYWHVKLKFVVCCSFFMVSLKRFVYHLMLFYWCRTIMHGCQIEGAANWVRFIWNG